MMLYGVVQDRNSTMAVGKDLQQDAFDATKFLVILMQHSPFKRPLLYRGWEVSFVWLAVDAQTTHRAFASGLRFDTSRLGSQSCPKVKWEAS
jgi:hypothetical protein